MDYKIYKKGEKIMKYCSFCGASTEDAATTCPQCGANLISEAAPVQTPGEQPNPVQTPSEQPNPAGGMYSQTPFTQTPASDMYSQTPFTQTPAGDMYSQTPFTQAPSGNMYAQAPAGDMYSQYGYAQTPAQAAVMPAETPRKKKSKKPLIITLSIIAVLAIGFCVWFFVFRKSSGNAEKNIKKQTKEYVNAIEDLDVEKLVELTVPKDVLKNLVILLVESGEIDTSMFGITDPEVLEDNFDEVYDSIMSLASVYINQAIKEYEIEADIKEYEITSVEKLDIDELLQTTYEAGNIDEDELLEAKELIHTKLKEFGIDPDEIYNVYATFDASISASGQTEDVSSDMLKELLEDGLDDIDIPFRFIDQNGGIALFMAYKYDGEYYMLPSLGIFAPSLIRYVEKSKKSNDITTAKSIKTAVETMLGNENAYDYFTTTGSYICYPVTADGLAQMPDEYATEFKQNLGITNDYPEVRYTKDGQTYFTFMVDDYGIVYVYIADDYSDSAWEICPDPDYLYY